MKSKNSRKLPKRLSKITKREHIKSTTCCNKWKNWKSMNLQVLWKCEKTWVYRTKPYDKTWMPPKWVNSSKTLLIIEEVSACQEQHYPTATTATPSQILRSQTTQLPHSIACRLTSKRSKRTSLKCGKESRKLKPSSASGSSKLRGRKHHPI
jgi:hypothetical protein